MSVRSKLRSAASLLRNPPPWPMLLEPRGSYLDRIRRRPDDLWAWFSLAQEVGGHPAALAAGHKLHRGNARFLLKNANTILEHARPRLAALSKQVSSSEDAETIGAAIEEIVRWKTIVVCTTGFEGQGGPGTYFGDAESAMERQWNSIIWPIVRGADFSSVVEIACGHGRHTDFVRRHARELHLVDVNESCLRACRQRFGDELDGCRFFYHLTDGNHLRMLPTTSVTFVCSWDSMVHFDKLVVRDYVLEVARVLKPGGSAFLHHSNFGAMRPNSDWVDNHGSRGDMSAEAMRHFADVSGLRMAFQRLSGKADGWGVDDLDCLSLLAKP